MRDDNRYCNYIKMSRRQFRDYKDWKITSIFIYVFLMIVTTLFNERVFGYIAFTGYFIWTTSQERKCEKQWIKDGAIKREKENCSDEKLKNKVARSRITDILTNSSKIINFNYTNTVEVVYGIEAVIHIHGNINDAIAIGCGTLDEIKESMVDGKYPTIEDFGMNKHGFAEMMNYYEEDMEGNLVKKHFIDRLFDEVSFAIKEEEKSIFTLLDEKSKDSLALRKQVIEDL